MNTNVNNQVNAPRPTHVTQRTVETKASPLPRSLIDKASDLLDPVVSKETREKLMPVYESLQNLPDTPTKKQLLFFGAGCLAALTVGLIPLGAFGGGYVYQRWFGNDSKRVDELLKVTEGYVENLSSIAAIRAGLEIAVKSSNYVEKKKKIEECIAIRDKYLEKDNALNEIATAIINCADYEVEHEDEMKSLKEQVNAFRGLAYCIVDSDFKPSPGDKLKFCETIAKSLSIKDRPDTISDIIDVFSGTYENILSDDVKNISVRDVIASVSSEIWGVSHDAVETIISKYHKQLRDYARDARTQEQA